MCPVRKNNVAQFVPMAIVITISFQFFGIDGGGGGSREKRS